MKTKPIQLAIFTSLSALILHGCTPYSESFDCPSGRGVGCTSLSQVNQMVEEGKLPLETRSEEALPEQALPPSKPKGPLDSKEEYAFIEAKNAHNGPINLLPKTTALETRPGSRLKIWLAGYEDEEGIYHAPSYVYASLKKPTMETAR